MTTYDLALLLSAVCLVGVTFAFVRSAAFSLFHPLTFYIAFHALLFVIRPIVARVMDFSFIYRLYQFTPSASDKLTVILASNLGFLCFAFFATRTGNVPMQFRQDKVIAAERDRFRQIFPWVAAICLPLGLYSLITLWSDASNEISYSTMVRDAGTGAYINTTTNGYVVEAQLMLASCGAIIAWLFRFRLLAIVPLIGFVVLRAGTGGRGPFVTALATVGLLYLYEQRKRFPSFRVLVGVALIVGMFAAVGADRGRSIRQTLGEDRTLVRDYGGREARFMEGMDLGNLEYFEYLVYVIPQRSGTYDYFLDNLQLFTEPIPRVLWKGKPVGPPFNKIFLMDYGYPIGMTRSLPGEGWYALGWIGVVIWCSLWGYGLGWIYRKYATGPQDTIRTAAYMVFLPILIIAFRDGQLMTIFRQGLFFFTPVVLWLAFARAAGVPSVVAIRQRLDKAQNRRRNAQATGMIQSSHLPAAVMRRHVALRDG